MKIIYYLAQLRPACCPSSSRGSKPEIAQLCAPEIAQKGMPEPPVLRISVWPFSPTSRDRRRSPDMATGSRLPQVAPGWVCD